MKKAVSLILLLIFTASLLTACSKEKTEETQNEYKPDFEIVNEVPQERTAGKMQAAEHFSGGDGSENNPYQISTPEELQLFSDVVNNHKFEDEINYLAKREHAAWYKLKINLGWKYGSIKDENEKTNPNLIQWDELDYNIQELNKKTFRDLPVLCQKETLKNRENSI